MQFHFRACIRAVTLSVLSCVLLPVTICGGQTKPGDMIVDIPFAFIVGENTLPPGHYLVTSIGEETLRISNRKNGVIFAIHSVRGNAPEGTGKLIFQRFGSRYFLSQLWAPATSRGKQLYPSKTEREVARAGNIPMARLELKTY